MGRHYKDITGQTFGRLTALHRLHNTKGRTKWLCVCDCGNLTEVLQGHLTSGHTKSCGCSHIKHGKCNARLYNIYDNIKQRCYTKTNPNYKNYGGRGIKVCDEWVNDFQAFYNWAMNNGYNDNLTIDRIDVNGNYEPNNCRWVDRKQQSRNRRSNHNYTIYGITHCLMDWCEIYNVNYGTVQSRLDRGWRIERALGV